MCTFQKLALAAVALRHTNAGVTSDFQRPRRARDLAAHEVGCAYTNTAPGAPDGDLFRGFACDSQAHVSFASPTSAFLSYVTPDVPSQIRYKRQDQQLWRAAQGTARSYTALASVDPQLWAPTMGAPSYTLEEVRAAANTTSWAVPGSASRRAPPYPRWLQAYNDPAMIYSSPVIHTVTLVDLDPGEVYEYELEDGAHAFRMPPPTYPTRLGLTADVGQTVVSNRSLAKLAALDPDAVLLSGDLSYADGWPWRWDSFGALASPLLSRVPVLVTGGNHEIGSSEAWLHYLMRWPTVWKLTSASGAGSVER